MAIERKETKKYVFTVEGETEHWYFDWLQNEINSREKSLYNVTIISEVQQSPRKYAKKANPLTTPIITHICDYESNEQSDVTKFKNILSELKDANSIKGKNLKYLLGYSNFTFELWMILHKQSCNSHLTNKTQYLRPINNAYGESFESLKQYKEEVNFKRCLSKLTLDDVVGAINRSKRIMDCKVGDGEVPEQFKTFTFYKENPELTIWKSVEGILKDCKLI